MDKGIWVGVQGSEFRVPGLRLRVRGSAHQFELGRMSKSEQHLSPGKRIFDRLASYGFAVVLLSFLLLLTLLGTLEQAEFGLYVVQKKYFDSLLLVHKLFGAVPIPLPGVYLLMSLLFVNLVCGAIVRAPKHWRYPGMLIAHGGILFLLLAGFVNHHYATYGHVQLFEGEASGRFRSYHEWVIEIRRLDADPSSRIHIIPLQQLSRSSGDQKFSSGELPFGLVVSGYSMNCRPVPAAGHAHASSVDGYFLQSLPKDKESEGNIAGAYIDVIEQTTGARQTFISWGLEHFPHVVHVGDERWAIGLVRRSWGLPFKVVLDKFTVEHHPNTRIPKVFMSEVTKIEGKTHEKFRISMNKPLRYRGYTLFQATWGPQNARPGDRLFSGFAVVRNPADHWPLYACIVVGAGLLIHLLQKLIFHLRMRTA